MKDNSFKIIQLQDSGQRKIQLYSLYELGNVYFQVNNVATVNIFAKYHLQWKNPSVKHKNEIKERISEIEDWYFEQILMLQTKTGQLKKYY